MLVNLDAVGVRGDGFVRSADSLGCVGLHVEHVDVARPAILEKENDGFGARFWALAFGQRFGAQQPGQGEAQQAEPADLEHVPARNTGFVKTAAGEGLLGHNEDYR